MTKRRSRATGKQNPRWGGRWTDEALELLHGGYGAFLPGELAKRINNACGTNFTARAIHTQAKREGIQAATAQGLLTLTEAARRLGMNRANLRHYITSHNLETHARGHHTFLTEKTWEIVKARYPELPEKCIDTTEAGRRLNFERGTIALWIRKGKLRAYKYGDVWMVSLSEVERLERIQTGNERIGDRDETHLD